MTITLTPKKILTIFLYTIALLFIANSIGLLKSFIFNEGKVYGVAYILNFNVKTSIPTLYSTFIIGICAFLLFFIARKERESRENYRVWYAIATVFSLLAIIKIIPIRRVFYFFIHYYFKLSLAKTITVLLILIFVLVVVFAIYHCMKLIKNLPVSIRPYFILSFVIFFIGNIVLDQIGNVIFHKFGKYYYLYAISYTIEELFEMIGVVVFIYSLTLYIKFRYGHFSILIT